ncbi:cupredoxin family copper-binding protein [Candidatus Woesearchaeota archaeon]|nr:cupredoxin family copper-binding protein [Candidatus Woesearchaeota archaeon]
MNKISLVLALLGVLLLVVGCTTPQTAPATTNPATTANTGNTKSAPAVINTATALVTIKNFAFNPSSLDIKVGDTVEFVNKDSDTHTVTLDNEQFSEILPAGGSVTHTFNEKGSFDYKCNFHPSMRGIVVVN